jgi:hypothetical protein
MTQPVRNLGSLLELEEAPSQPSAQAQSPSNRENVETTNMPVGRSGLIYDAAELDSQIKPKVKKDLISRETAEELGAAIGFGSAYKDVGTNWGKPGAKFFVPKKPEIPEVDPQVRIAQIRQKLIDEANAKRRPPGEMEHNAETQRRALATNRNLATIPGADRQLIVNTNMRWSPQSQMEVPEPLWEEEIGKQAKQQFEEEQSPRNAAKRARMISNVRAGMRTAGKTAQSVYGGFQAGQNFWDAYDEYKKKGLSDAAIAKLWEGAGNTLTAIPNPITQTAGHYLGYKNAQNEDEAISHALMGAGSAAMLVPSPFTEIGGLATIGAGMAYPHINPDIKKKIRSKFPE